MFIVFENWRTFNDITLFFFFFSNPSNMWWSYYFFHLQIPSDRIPYFRAVGSKIEHMPSQEMKKTARRQKVRARNEFYPIKKVKKLFFFFKRRF